MFYSNENASYYIRFLKYISFLASNAQAMINNTPIYKQPTRIRGNSGKPKRTVKEKI